MPIPWSRVLVEEITMPQLVKRYSAIYGTHPSIYGATAPNGPRPPSYDASIHLYSQLFSSIFLFPAVCSASL